VPRKRTGDVSIKKVVWIKSPLNTELYKLYIVLFPSFNETFSRSFYQTECIEE